MVFVKVKVQRLFWLNVRSSLGIASPAILIRFAADRSANCDETIMISRIERAAFCRILSRDLGTARVHASNATAVFELLPLVRCVHMCILHKCWQLPACLRSWTNTDACKTKLHTAFFCLSCKACQQHCMLSLRSQCFDICIPTSGRHAHLLTGQVVTPYACLHSLLWLASSDLPEDWGLPGHWPNLIVLDFSVNQGAGAYTQMGNHNIVSKYICMLQL